MPAKTLGAVYMVESKYFAAGVLSSYRARLPDSEKKCILVTVKVLGIVAGERSYDCEVFVTRDKVMLSSKSLVQLHASESSQPARKHPDTCYESLYQSFGRDDGIQEREDIPDSDVLNCHTLVTASDWRRVDHFDDQLAKRCPTIDIQAPGRLRCNVIRTPCALFLAFFPMALVEACFDGWRKHAADHDRRGLKTLDTKMFLRFVALFLRMGLLGLRRRDHHFTAEVKSTALSQSTFESLLYTIRDAGFPAYEEGEQLPDGCTALGNDPLRTIRRFADQLVHMWQELSAWHSSGGGRDNGWLDRRNQHPNFLPPQQTYREGSVPKNTL
jgi:hypothetical protein